MKLEEFLDITVNDIHTVVLATSDEFGNPVTAAIDMMMHDGENIYFLTAKGKSLYSRLKNNENISFTGIKGESTMSSIAVSLKGKAREVGRDKLSEIYKKNPYMLDIYPSDTSREALTVFEIYEGVADYLDLTTTPVYRKNFNFSSETRLDPAYLISDKCIGCSACLSVCPTSCISVGEPFMIRQENCLRCGNCYEVCRFDAIIKNKPE